MALCMHETFHVTFTMAWLVRTHKIQCSVQFIRGYNTWAHMRTFSLLIWHIFSCSFGIIQSHHPWRKISNSNTITVLEIGRKCKLILIARFVRPTWGPSGADRTQVSPMLVPWTLLSGYVHFLSNYSWLPCCGCDQMLYLGLKGCNFVLSVPF